MNRRFSRIVGSSLFTMFVALSSLSAQNWSQWRGPKANGAALGNGYPVKWSKTDNVVWKAKLPGIGASTPVIWDDNMFVTGGKDGQNYVVCVDRLTGKPRWTTMLGKEDAGRNRKASGSNSSPISDGKHVWVYFKSGDFGCLDLAGKIIWQKNLQKEYGEDTLWWDLGTSPVLTKTGVVVACMQTGDSYVASFDKTSGKVLWKVDRNLEAPLESAQSYTTPVVVQNGTSELVVVLGADHVTAHDGDTGKEVWRVGNLNPDGQRMWRSISSPVAADGFVVAPYARGGSLTCIKLGGKGDVTKSHVVWSKGRPSADVPTPVAEKGRVYICTDRGQVAMLDIKTGKALASLNIPGRRGTFTASPVLAAGHLYVTNEGGTTFVIKVAEKLELVSTNKLDEFTVATPICSDGKIYLRTDDFLYCFGKK